MLADFPWRRFNRFIDVGGSSGSFLAALLERHPNSSGIIFDLPQVALIAKGKQIIANGLADLHSGGWHTTKSGADLLQVAKHADAVWREKRAALLPRVQFMGGSFLAAGAWHF